MLGVLAACIVTAGALYRLAPSLTVVEVYAPTAKASSATPLCPWRKSEEDMKVFFPGATHYDTHIAILSERLAQLKARLGRWPRPEENPFYIHDVYADNRLLGRVALQRVKGEFGAIEVVLAVDNFGAVRGLRLQRLREPDVTARVLQSPQWLHSFRGQDQSSVLKLGVDVPDVPPVAKKSATAIVEGVRSLLVLLDEASQTTARATARATARRQDKHH